MPTPKTPVGYDRQASFATGELTPRALGRTDYVRYDSALSLCDNWYITEQGGLRTRPGSVYVSNTEADTVSRLIPFQFNREQTYVLVFSNFSFFVVQNGAVVLDDVTGQVAKFSTPYSSAQLKDIRYVQSKDVLVLCHQAHPPYEIGRVDHDEWLVAPIDFGIGAVAPTNVTATATGGGTRQYLYVVTTVSGSTQEESGASNVASVNNASTLSGDAFNTITWTAATDVRRYQVYRYTGGIYNFIGNATQTTFTDDGIEPDVLSSYPIENNPFVGGNYPRAVTFYQQRLVFGGSIPNPQTLWFSRVGEPFNFSYSTVGSAADAIEITIRSRVVDSIQHLMPTRTLLIFTLGAEWEATHTGAGLSLETISINPQTYRGCGHVQPAAVGHEVMFIEGRGDKVRSANYSWEQDTYVTNDLTVLAEHLVRSHEIVDWCYAQTPNSTLWLVRADGALLSLAYNATQELVGWAQHHTDGWYEAVATVSEGEEDAVYAVVRRTINGATRRFVERFGDTLWVDPCNAITLDASLQYSGPAVSSVTGLGHLEGEMVTVIGDCGYQGVQVVSGGAVTFVQPVTTASVGLPFTCTGKQLPVHSLGKKDVTNIQKHASEVWLRLRDTRNIKVGATLDSLVGLQERQPSIDYYELSELFNGIYKTSIPSSYDYDGSTYFCVDTPSPAELLMIGRNIGHGA